MKTIEAFEALEKAAEAGQHLTEEETGITKHVFWAYRRARDKGLDHLDFSESIWNEQIGAIAECLRRFEIKTITISSGYSGMAETIWAFQQQGAKLAGVTRVLTGNRDWKTREPETSAAFLLEIPA